MLTQQGTDTYTYTYTTIHMIRNRRSFIYSKYIPILYSVLITFFNEITCPFATTQQLFELYVNREREKKCNYHVRNIWFCLSLFVFYFWKIDESGYWPIVLLIFIATRCGLKDCYFEFALFLRFGKFIKAHDVKKSIPFLRVNPNYNIFAYKYCL